MRWFKTPALIELPERMAKLESWMTEGSGHYVLEREQQLIAEELTYIFGYHGVEMTVTPRHGLMEASQIKRCHLFHPTPLGDLPQHLVADPFHWPVKPGSIDLALLHHVVEVSDRPHRLLSQACNAIIPGGKLIVTGFNPFSFCHGASVILPYYYNLFRGVKFISVSRLKDWLTLLGFTVEHIYESGYLFPLNRHLEHISEELLEHRCYRWLMPFGSFYVLVATRETPGMIPIKPKWNHITPHISGQPAVGG